MLAARGRGINHLGSKSVFLAGTGHLGSGCNVFLKGGAALSFGLEEGFRDLCGGGLSPSTLELLSCGRTGMVSENGQPTRGYNRLVFLLV